MNIYTLASFALLYAKRIAGKEDTHFYCTIDDRAGPIVYCGPEGDSDADTVVFDNEDAALTWLCVSLDINKLSPLLKVVDALVKAQLWVLETEDEPPIVFTELILSIEEYIETLENTIGEE